MNAPRTPHTPPPCYGHGKDKWLASCDTCTAWHLHQNRLMSAERARAKRVAPYLDEIRAIATAAAWAAVADTAADTRHPDLLDTDLTALFSQIAEQVAAQADQVTQDILLITKDLAANNLTSNAPVAASATSSAPVAAGASGHVPNYDATNLPDDLAQHIPDRIPARPAAPGARPALRVLSGGQSDTSVA